MKKLLKNFWWYVVGLIKITFAIGIACFIFFGILGLEKSTIYNFFYIFFLFSVAILYVCVHLVFKVFKLNEAWMCKKTEEEKSSPKTNREAFLEELAINEE